MSILEELSKHNKKWVKYAFSVCRDYDLSRDLVQESYLKVVDFKECNDAGFRKVIKNTFINYIKRQNKQTELIETFYNVDDNSITDYELRVLNRFYKLPEITQELISNKANQSFRDLEENYGINFQKIRRDINKAIKTITDEK